MNCLRMIQIENNHSQHTQCSAGSPRDPSMSRSLTAENRNLAQISSALSQDCCVIITRLVIRWLLLLRSVMPSSCSLMLASYQAQAVAANEMKCDLQYNCTLMLSNAPQIQVEMHKFIQSYNPNVNTQI